MSAIYSIQNPTPSPIYASNVVEKDAHRINDYLATAFPEQPAIITSFSRGHKAVSCYRIDVAEGTYVLRLLPENLSETKAQQQLYMMQQASDLGIAPKIIEIANRIVLMEHIKERTLTPQDAKDHAEAIGGSLRKAHETAANPYADQLRYLDAAERYFTSLKNRNDRDNFPGLEETIELIRRDWPKLSDLKTNIHGDLHPHNGFWTGSGLKLIDWEHTKWDHPYLDLARFAMSLAIDGEDELTLLHGYFGQEPTEEQKEEYFLAKRLNFAFMALMCFKVTVGILDAEPQNPIDPESQIKDWLYYKESFAVTQERMPVQFFYDTGKCALKMMREMS